MAQKELMRLEMFPAYYGLRLIAKLKRIPSSDPTQNSEEDSLSNVQALFQLVFLDSWKTFIAVAR